MRNILIILMIVIFIFSLIEAKKKKKGKNKKKIEKELDPLIGNCILTNSKSSMNLKSYIFDHRDDDLSEILEPSKIKLEKSDLDIIEECKKKATGGKTDL